MKTTRLILALAAALSLGLAVFANVRTHGNVTASTQSMINSDASLSDADSAASGIKVSDDSGGCGFSGAHSAVSGIKVSDDSGGCGFSGAHSAVSGIKVSDDSGGCGFSGQSSKNIAT
jgi:hypothetical protein